MNRISLTIALLVSLFFFQVHAQQLKTIMIEGKEAAAGSIILKLKPQPSLPKSAQIAAKTNLLRLYRATVEKQWMTGSELWSVHPDETERAINELNRNPLVEYALPNYYCDKVDGPAGQIPNDPLFSSQWHLLNTGQDGGKPGADIDATEAWNTTTGDSTIVVAVLDSGVDIDHPDLQPNIWINKREIPGNGIDDDGNGFVDDANGWDFVSKSNNPRPRGNSHGTQCAGLIAAVQNNGVGISGIAPRVKIMALRNLDSTGGGFIADGLSALEYAIRNGARITNHSYANINVSYQPQLEMYALANQRGLLVVASAGNARADLDQDAFIAPATLPYPNIVCVGNSDHNDSLAVSSMYGLNEVDVVAPGDGTITTTVNGTYGGFSGTSASAPVASGVAALIWSAFPNLSAVQVKQQLILSSDVLPSLLPYSGSNGRVNAARAVKGLYITPVELNSRTINFGIVKINAVTTPQYLVLRNASAAAVTIDSVVVGTGFSLAAQDTSSKNRTSIVIGARDSAAIAIFFNPAGSSPYVSLVTVYQTNSYAQPVQQRSYLRGVGEFTGTIVATRSVSGRWTKQSSPYLVNNDFQIAGELVMEPGTRVLFGGRYSVTVTTGNKLIARGTVTDSITLSCRDQAIGWNGIILDSAKAGDVVFEFVNFEYSKAMKQVFPHDYYHTVNLGAVITSGLSSPTIRNCRFSDNQTDGGPIILVEQGEPVIENIVFSRNKMFSGVLYAYRMRRGVFNNLLIVDNKGDWGSTVQFGSGTFIVNNLTATGNAANFGMTIDQGTDVTFNNSIFYGNSSRYAAMTLGQAGGPASAVKFNYCDFDTLSPPTWLQAQTPSGGAHKIVWGAGNMLVDPKFASAANGDYRLQAGSPCVDKGSPTTSGMMTSPADLIGNERIANGRIDLGAFESASSPLMAPAIPALAWPADNATAAPVQPSLQWISAQRAGGYRVQVSADASFLAGLAHDVALPFDTVRTVGPLQNATKYYWRVSSVNDAGASDWSGTRSFTTAGVPSAPSLGLPADKATGVPVKATLTWTKSAGASKYWIQMTDVPVFPIPNGRVVADTMIADDSFSPGNLEPEHMYYWRIASVGDGGTTWSGVRSFTTGVGLPRVVSLTLPRYGSTNVAVSTVFRWQGPTGAKRFRVQLAADSAFSSLTLDDTSSTVGALAVSKLVAGVKSYWRVAGMSSIGLGPWSPTSLFTTATGVPVGPLPSQAALDRPLDGLTALLLPVSLWAVLGIDVTFLHFQVAYDSLFSRLVLNDSLNVWQSIEAKGLKTGTMYYWRARYRNDVGWGQFSRFRSFTTGGPPSAVELIGAEIPLEYSLSQNFPNPFNPTTTMTFALPKSCLVSLKVYDLLGRELATLASDELAPGYYKIVWRANVPSGVYFYRIQAGEFSQTKRLILLK